MRVLAEDGAIARVQHGASAGNQLLVDVVARDGAWRKFNSIPAPWRNSGKHPRLSGLGRGLSRIGRGASPPFSAFDDQTQPLTSLEYLTVSRRERCELRSKKKLPQQFDVVHRIRHHRLRVLAADVWEFGRDIALKLSEVWGRYQRPRSTTFVFIILASAGVHADITGGPGPILYLRDHSFWHQRGRTTCKKIAHILKESELIDLCSSFPDQIVWQVVALFRTESQHVACLLRRQHEHGAFEHLCLIHAAQLAPSSMQSLGNR